MEMVELYNNLYNSFRLFSMDQRRHFLKINGKKLDAIDPIKEFVDPKRKRDDGDVQKRYYTFVFNNYYIVQ